MQLLWKVMGPLPHLCRQGARTVIRQGLLCLHVPSHPVLMLTMASSGDLRRQACHYLETVYQIGPQLERALPQS